jgi:hypothetical protein
MGKAGIEPNDQGSAVNAMWQNEPDRLAKAKSGALLARSRGEHATAHSIMLSAYITALSGNPAEGRHPVKFFLLAAWHAFCLASKITDLNHNQLDVWLQFMLKLRTKLPVFKNVLNKTLIRAAAQEVAEAVVYGKPHQIALAYLTYAEVVLVTKFHANEMFTIINTKIQEAVNLEQLIREEPDQPMGLRQFVRILRKAGEMHLKPEMRESNSTSVSQAHIYLQRALILARREEVNCHDQIPKIMAVIPRL